MKRLKIPGTVRIAGHKIKVAYDPGLRARAESYGQYHEGSQLILIDPGGPKEIREETYIHELVEAANCISQLGMPHNVIQCLSALLHQALTSGEGDPK